MVRYTSVLYLFGGNVRIASAHSWLCLHASGHLIKLALDSRPNTFVIGVELVGMRGTPAGEGVEVGDGLLRGIVP